MRNFSANIFITDFLNQQQGLQDVWHFGNTHNNFTLITLLIMTLLIMTLLIMTLLIMTLLIMTLLISEHTSASSPVFQLVRFLFAA